MTQVVKCLLYKHWHLRLESQHPQKNAKHSYMCLLALALGG